MNVITYWSRLLSSYSTNVHPCALVQQWCACDWMEGVEWQTRVSSSHTCVSISNTAHDPPTPLGTLGFSWISTHHRASPIFVPLLIKHPNSNVVFLLWQVCYVIKSLFFLEGFPSLCTQQLLPHLFLQNKQSCLLFLMDRRELSYPISFYMKWERRKPRNFVFKTWLPNPAALPKGGVCSTCTPENLAEHSAQSRLSQCWLSFQLFQNKSTPSWKPTSMQMCII